MELQVPLASLVSQALLVLRAPLVLVLPGLRVQPGSTERLAQQAPSV